QRGRDDAALCGHRRVEMDEDEGGRIQEPSGVERVDGPRQRRDRQPLLRRDERKELHGGNLLLVTKGTNEALEGFHHQLLVVKGKNWLERRLQLKIRPRPGCYTSVMAFDVCEYRAA